MTIGYDTVKKFDRRNENHSQYRSETGRLDTGIGESKLTGNITKQRSIRIMTQIHQTGRTVALYQFQLFLSSRAEGPEAYNNE